MIQNSAFGLFYLLAYIILEIHFQSIILIFCLEAKIFRGFLSLNDQLLIHIVYDTILQILKLLGHIAL